MYTKPSNTAIDNRSGLSLYTWELIYKTVTVTARVYFLEAKWAIGLVLYVRLFVSPT